MKNKRIVFATFGSLGDLHPYLALARELKRRGHRPLIATFDGYRDAVQAEDIEFAPMRPAMAEFGDPAAAMQRLLDPDKGSEYLVRHLFMPHIRASYRDLDRVATDADLLVTHPIAFAGPLVAEKRGLPWASSVLAPFSLMSVIDPPLFAPAPWLQSLRKLGVTPYRLAFGLAKLIARGWEKPLAALRAELGLPPTKKFAQFEGQYSPALNLALFSSALAARQIDWPANTVVCGFPRYDGPPPDAQTQAELDAILAAGEPPIVFALGSSAVMVAGDFWEQAIEAVQRLKRRAILITGAPPEQHAHAPRTVKVYRYLPYSAVFPRAAVVVHPGGIGTLAQALAAGRPQLIVPVAFDQLDNAQRATRCGVARSVPFRFATAAAMTKEVAALLAGAGYEVRARAVGEEIRNENGARAACAELEGLLGRA